MAVHLNANFPGHPSVCTLSNRAFRAYLYLLFDAYPSGLLKSPVNTKPRRYRELVAAGLLGVDGRNVVFVPGMVRVSLAAQETEAERKRVDRDSIIARDGMVCGICGNVIKAVQEIHIDHIVPISQGGKSVPENLQVAHARCNLSKGARLL